LIERADEDLVSESMRNFSKRDKTFSHCGLAFIEDGEVYVYNNMAGEENRSEKMIREPYDSFVSPAKKSAFGIFRYALTDTETEKLHTVTKEYHQKGLLFDKTFDLKTDDKMYCAEMIYKFLKTATAGRVLLPTSKIQNFRVKDPKYKGLVMKEFEYVGLDDLFLNPFCKEVARVIYQ
jgi:Permuted papain-like amidase enzyme, YaeF/YiiX, C92 family